MSLQKELAEVRDERDRLRKELGLIHEGVLTEAESCCAGFKKQLTEENARLQAWVNDLQSHMFINCVYCGHRYGPDPGTPVAMADVLKQHIEICPKHPMSQLRIENESLRKQLSEAAMEINCAGPVAHRIRMLREEMGEWCAQYRAQRDALNVYVERLCAKLRIVKWEP